MNFIDEHSIGHCCCPNPDMQRERWKDLNYGKHYNVTVYITFCNNCGHIVTVDGDK